MENTLAFQECRKNTVKYPCLTTRTLLEKARDELVSRAAQVKIGEIYKVGQKEWIDEDAKAEKLNWIATGQVELEYDLEKAKKKFYEQLKQQNNEWEESDIF